MKTMEIEQLAALLLLVDFLLGITFGVVGGAAVASKRGILTWPDMDSPVSAGARVIYGIYLRGYLRGPSADPGRRLDDPAGDDDPASPGLEADQ